MNKIDVTDNANAKAKKYGVKKKLDKQVETLGTNTQSNSLWFRPLIAGSKDGIWKFRIDKHFWGLTQKIEENHIEVYDVIKHLK